MKDQTRIMKTKHKKQENTRVSIKDLETGYYFNGSNFAIKRKVWNTLAAAKSSLTHYQKWRNKKTLPVSVVFEIFELKSLGYINANITQNAKLKYKDVMELLGKNGERDNK